MDEERSVPAEHIEVRWAGYTILLHPGAQSRVSLADEDDGDLPVYRQTEPYPLLAGIVKIRQYQVGVYDGPHARNVRITVTDADSSVESIAIVLKPAAENVPAETIRFEGGAVTCPPFCA